MNIHAWIPLNTPDADTDAFDGRHIDVLKPQWGRVNVAAEGLRFFDQESDGPRRMCDTFADALRAHADEAMFFVGGRWPHIAPILTDPAVAASTRDAIVARAVEYRMGVEIDFEGYDEWPPEAYAGYLAFLTDLGEALHAHGLPLGVDLPPLTGPDDRYPLTYADLEPLPIDRLIPMCYDYQLENGPGVPLAPVQWTLDVFHWISSQISDPDRIVIGIPAYGYIADSDGMHILSKCQIRERLGSLDGFMWDDASFEWHRRDADLFATHIDQRGLDAKRAVLEDAGVRTISVWHLGGGNDWFSR